MKNISFWLGKRIKSIVLLLLVMVLLSGCATNVPQEVDDYLMNYGKAIDWKQPLDSNTFGNAEGYQVFLAGEDHTKAKNLQAQKMLTSYFHENMGVRYLLYETGLGSGFLLEHYIQTGQEAELDYYMEQLNGTLGCTKEQYNFWKWLCEYNSDLPESQKIHIIGLDIDHQFGTATKGISLLLDNSVIPADSIAAVIKKIKDNNTDAITDLGLAMKQYPNDVKNVFGSNYDWIEQFYKNFAYTNKFYSQTEKQQASKSNDLRDEAMMSNFLFALSKHPQEIFFGEFGSEHILQSTCETEYHSSNCNRFGMRLNAEDSPVKEKVCSILYLFAQKNNLLSLFHSYSPVNYRLFENWYGKDTLFSLNELESPFSEKEYVFTKSDNMQAPTTDCIQKILLLTDDDCTPYK